MITRKLTILAVAAAAVAALAGCAATPAPAAASKHVSAVTPTPTPTPALGTRENPFPAGATGQYDVHSPWTFTFLSTNGNAWATVQSLDTELNTTPPAAGTMDVLGTLKVDVGQTPNPVNPSSAVTYNYVGSDGNTYQIDGCGDLGDQDLRMAGDMYSGATKTFLICAEVPATAVPGGTWAVAQNYVNSTSPTIYFKGE